MFSRYLACQYTQYLKERKYCIEHPEGVIALEQFLMRQMLNMFDLHLAEIVRDYNEASYLFPFWRHYAPQDRGRKPRGDQIPWMEVGEKVLGNKILRYFSNNFEVKDTGLPVGADGRCIVASPRIRELTGRTDAAWIFLDIKSSGPRDDDDHAVMSPYQLSGDGVWQMEEEGLINTPVIAHGTRKSQKFYCALAPIYILSDGTVAPLITFVIKPVYRMIMDNGHNSGQPLAKIQLACIPNGLLLTVNPDYLTQFHGLLFPGKDADTKMSIKKRVRVSFSLLKKIGKWRVAEIKVV